eukprot:gb/GECG01004635.1/.p1 GENE.gb/GECG01004635.1/~~gb/GECG01004635.1/.p1  ORF type:complete len:463 (+),score=60.74 gb/GECG01004635.1/:1-1389(+)
MSASSEQDNEGVIESATVEEAGASSHDTPGQTKDHTSASSMSGSTQESSPVYSSGNGNNGATGPDSYGETNEKYRQPETSSYSTDQHQEQDSSGYAEEVPKLFAGQLPRSMSEHELRSIFEEFGTVTSFDVLRHKATGDSRGCAFVQYATKDAADKAQEHLNGRRTLPGMSNPMIVRPAERKKNVNRKLFFASIPDTSTEEDIRPLFETYGEIDHFVVLKTPDGRGRGCGFCQYSESDACNKAIENLDKTVTIPGAKGPIQVRYADTPEQKAARQREKNMGGQMMGGAPGGNFGMNPQMGMNPMMGGYPMNNPAMGYGGYMPPPMQGGPMGGYDPHAMGAYGMPGMPPAAPGMGAPPAAGGGSGGTKQSQGPSGANLFVYNIPIEFGDPELYSTFAPFGNVVSAKVFIDKNTQRSKGFGFVSFDNVPSAQNAIQAMNGMVIGGKRLKVSVKNSNRSGEARPY